MSSYLHEDGSPDINEEILTSARCFVGVIGKLLQPNEGMIVELKFQEKYPNDAFGKFMVCRDGTSQQIKVNKIDIDNELYQYDDGQLVWVD